LVKTLFLYTGGLIAFSSFVALIVKKNRKLSDIFMGLLFLSSVYMLLFYAFKDATLHYPLLHNLLDILGYVLYYIIPSFLFVDIYLNSMLEQKILKRFYLFALPSFIYLAIFTILMIPYIPYMSDYLIFHPDHALGLPLSAQYLDIEIFDLVGFVLYCIYFVISFVFLFPLLPWNHKQKLPAFFFFSSFISSLFLVVIFQYTGLYLLAGASLILTIVTFDMILFKYPDVDRVISVSATKHRYKHSQLLHVDLAKLERKLNQFIVCEKKFLDDNLTIINVAEALSISVNQLSEYINTVHEKSFNAFINSFRIQEAMVIMKTQPDIKVVVLAYEVGFSTVSTFYKYFKLETGYKPLEYLKRA